MPFRKYILLFALVASLPAARAQEDKYLDKTPPSVYGPATTRYITPMRLKDNLGTYQSLVQEQPQLIGDIHRFTFAQRLGNRIQNLGNNGTAAKPIFFRMPRYIGITAGFHAYDLYFRRPEQFRYYDTKSPYTHIYAMLARFGSFFTEVCHTRNVTPYWNIGAHYRQMMTDKEWIPNYSPGDRNAVANGLDLFTHVKTPAGSYELLAHALIMKHRVRETGGIMAYGGRSVFEYKQEQELLEFSKLWEKNISVYNRLERGEGDKYPENSDYRRRFQLYHQLALREALWLYHELGIQKNRYRCQIPLTKFNKVSIGGDIKDSEKELKYTNTIQTLQNELGLKGEWKDLFYRGYYRHKGIAWKAEQAAQDDQDLHEHYLGLCTRYHLFSTEEDYAHLGGAYLFGGLYKAQLGYTASLWEIAGEHTRYAPSLLSQRYHIHYRQWNNNWQPSLATQVRGNLRLEIGGILFKPGVRLTRVDNHVYFQYVDGGTYEQTLIKTNPNFPVSRLRDLARQRVSIAKPQQAQDHANIIVVDTVLNFALGMGIHWDNDVAFAQVLGPDAGVFRVPTFLMNTKLYYASETEQKNAALQAGIDVHVKTSYKADGYDPVIQQFYLQDAFNVYSYPVVDLFCNFRIQTFTAFAKLSHINEYVPEASYFVTPFYPGQKLALDVGVSWTFFD